MGGSSGFRGVPRASRQAWSEAEEGAVRVMTGWRAVRAGAFGLVAVALLSGCGGSGSAAVATGAPTTGGPGRRGFDQAELQRIQDCLKAAGISIPTPSGGFRSGRPTDRPPTGTPPADRPRPSGTSPTDRPRPSGGPSGPNGGLFGDPKVRAALDACGITLPTGRPAGMGGTGATPAPTPTG